MLDFALFLTMLSAVAGHKLSARGDQGACSMIVCDVHWCLVNRPPPTKAAFDNRIGCLMLDPENNMFGNDCGTTFEGSIRPLPAAMHSETMCPVHETGEKKGVIYQAQYQVWRSRTMGDDQKTIYQQQASGGGAQPIVAYCRIINPNVHCDKGTDKETCSATYNCQNVDGDPYDYPTFFGSDD